MPSIVLTKRFKLCSLFSRFLSPRTFDVTSLPPSLSLFPALANRLAAESQAAGCGGAPLGAPGAVAMARDGQAQAATMIFRDNTSMQTQPGDVDTFKAEERMSTLDETETTNNPLNCDDVNLETSPKAKWDQGRGADYGACAGPQKKEEEEKCACLKTIIFIPCYGVYMCCTKVDTSCIEDWTLCFECIRSMGAGALDMVFKR